MLTDADLLNRVDAWIDSRDLPGPVAAIADQWSDVSSRYGPGSAPGLGVLLALVTEAWDQSCAAGGGVVIVESVGPRGGFFVVTEHLAPTQRFKAVGGERVNRLLAALEAVPK